jgi:SAM-dependent methyltransferase
MSSKHLFPRVDYKPLDLEYQNSPPTYPLWERIIYYIKKHNSINLVDMGCSTGAVNQFLTKYTYNYYGIDKSQYLIDEAINRWGNEHIKFECNDWNTTNTVVNCDCLLLLGVLPYGLAEYGYSENISPWNIYNKLIERYNPTQIIIRETCKIQNDAEIDLETVDLTPFLEIATDVEYINVDTILGNKVLINVTRERT